MKHEWILDVLTDLKNFARANGLPALSDQLTETVELAAVEISSCEQRTRPVNGDERAYGGYSPQLGESRRA